MVEKFATAIFITQRKLKRFTVTSIFNTLSGDCRNMSEDGLIFNGKNKSYLSLSTKYFQPDIARGCTRISVYTTDIAMPYEDKNARECLTLIPF